MLTSILNTIFQERNLCYFILYNRLICILLLPCIEWRSPRIVRFCQSFKPRIRVWRKSEKVSLRTAKGLLSASFSIASSILSNVSRSSTVFGLIVTRCTSTLSEDTKRTRVGRCVTHNIFTICIAYCE